MAPICPHCGKSKGEQDPFCVQCRTWVPYKLGLSLAYLRGEAREKAYQEAMAYLKVHHPSEYDPAREGECGRTVPGRGTCHLKLGHREIHRFE